MCAICRRGLGPMPAQPKSMSNHKGVISRQHDLVIHVFARPGNPDVQAVSGRGCVSAHFAGGWTIKEEEAVRQACEATRGGTYEVA